MKTEAEKLELKKAKQVRDLKTETANQLNDALTVFLNQLRKKGGQGSDIMPEVKVRAGAGTDYIYDVAFTVGWSSQNWITNLIAQYIDKENQK
jgi:hypothetical protein